MVGHSKRHKLHMLDPGPTEGLLEMAAKSINSQYIFHGEIKLLICAKSSRKVNIARHFFSSDDVLTALLADLTRCQIWLNSTHVSHIIYYHLYVVKYYIVILSYSLNMFAVEFKLTTFGVR